MTTAPASVLIIDDVDTIVDEMLTMLDLQDIPAAGARNLEQALAELERFPRIRIIACDLMLGRECGLDIVELVEGHPPLRGRTFEYVFITGNATCQLSLKASARHRVLAKPVRPRALIELFHELLARSAVE